MSTLKNLWLNLGSFLIMILSFQATAQTFQLNNAASTMKIDGTSNLHDWTIEAKNMQGKMTADVENGKLENIKLISINIEAESLKSGKSAMDKNTYKALNTGKHKQITFTLDKIKKIDCSASGDCKITASGYLTIAGTRKLVDVNLAAKVSAGKIVLSGNTPIIMSQYGVEPPTAMFGSITTGDKVDIKFQVVFTN